MELLSLVLIAVAPSFVPLMVARATLGVVIGAFWSLATATGLQLVPEASVPKALGAIYTGERLLEQLRQDWKSERTRAAEVAQGRSRL